MRLLLTGLNGTLAPKLAQAAARRGWQVMGWDRSRVPPHDTAAAAAWLARCRPLAIAHLAMGDAAWAAWLAQHAAANGLPMVFTSTAMVFHHLPDGPHAVHDTRTAQDDYGRSKIACEDAVLAAHPQASVARIGWQIDADAQGNNMLAQLDAWQAREGCVAASRAWRPACSFMADTAEAVLDLIASPLPGAVHLDSNGTEAHSFDAIVAALQRQFDRQAWVLRPNDDYRHDQRLVGGGRHLPGLSTRLPF
jgi:dTDP-4-dehydrorhamnose reductase